MLKMLAKKNKNNFLLRLFKSKICIEIEKFSLFFHRKKSKFFQRKYYLGIACMKAIAILCESGFIYIANSATFTHTFTHERTSHFKLISVRVFFLSEIKFQIQIYGAGRKSKCSCQSYKKLK